MRLHEKALRFKDVNKLLIGRKEILNGFESKMLQIKKITHGTARPDMSYWSTFNLATRLEILTTKEILQKLPIPLPQVKAGNQSEIK